MMRYVKIFFLSMAVIALVAGTAFAGTVKVSHGATNTPYYASLEALGAARNINIVGITTSAANHGIEYALGQILTSGNLVSVTLSGATFDGSQLAICATNGTGTGNMAQIAAATPAAGATTYNFQTSFGGAVNNSAGDIIYLSTAGACNTAGAINVPLRLPITTVAGSATISLNINTSGGISVDPATAAGNLAVVRSEYAGAVNGANNHTIDYLGTPGDGTRLLSGGSAGNVYAASIGAANITKVTNDLGTVNGTQAVSTPVGLSVGAVVGLTDTQNWQGVSKVFLSGSGTCTTDIAANNVVGVVAPTGGFSLTIPTAAFNTTGANNYMLCVVVNGTSALSIRTIQSNVDVNVTGTGANDPSAGSYSSEDIWNTNAYQGFIGWLVNSAVLPTYCLISNSDTTKTATVLMDVISSEGSVVVSGTLGTVAPKTAKLATFTSNSASITGGTAISLSTLPADNRYSAKLTVTVTPANATVTCIQTDPTTGVKRAVPVFANNPNTE